MRKAHSGPLQRGLQTHPLVPSVQALFSACLIWGCRTVWPAELGNWAHSSVLTCQPPPTIVVFVFFTPGAGQLGWKQHCQDCYLIIPLRPPPRWLRPRNFNWAGIRNFVNTKFHWSKPSGDSNACVFHIGESGLQKASQWGWGEKVASLSQISPGEDRDQPPSCDKQKTMVPHPSEQAQVQVPHLQVQSLLLS
jgi:hypothetical protein